MASGKPSRFWPRLLVFAYALPRLIVRRRRPESIRRILVAHHLLLGDTIMLAGLLKKLRRDYPAAGIDVLVPVAWLPIFAGAPYGVRALPYDPRSLASQRELLACGPYEWALVPADNRWSWVASAMGARWITAFAGGPGGSKDWPVDEHVAWPTTAEAWGDIASRLAPGQEPAPFVLGEWPAPGQSADAAALPAVRYAVLHLGASSPHKLWPAEHWRALAEALDVAGVRVVWSAGPRELDLVRAVDAEGRFVSMAGKLDLAGLWHLLAGAAVLVSPDTGVAHLARLTGTPAVVLFGPGSPIISGPGRFWRDSPFAVVWVEDIPCRDQNLIFERPLPWVRHCWRSVAECGNPRCIQQIDENRVMQAIERVAGIRLGKDGK
ncbi:MAG TPA: glycosyltransferase family 9 protein [Azonexus sp.]|nr:glycosyltransferase family 9 protein [Azonexus sp.]